jgi:long-chain fatty acid transport protein
MVKRIMLVLAGLCLIAAPALAQGHLLHAVGPVNSAIGGGGVALPMEALGALHYNPALIAKVEGNQITFATEFFKPGLRVEATVRGLHQTTDATEQLGVIPAFGWQGKLKPDSKLAVGFGLLGVAGFRTDYPQDSGNFLLLPQPDGFGRIATDLSITKIPASFALQVNPKLAIGASINLYRGALAITPLPVVIPDVGAGFGILPNAHNQVFSWGFGVQFGVYYEPTPMVGVGASFTTKQKFQQYEWNSTVANPNNPRFQLARQLTFNLDGPAVLSFGVGLKPTPKVKIAVDGRFVKYEGVAGIGEDPGVDTINHRLIGIGWRNIFAGMGGIEFQATDKIAVRAGYNQAQTPIREQFSVTSMGTPATFQKHFTGGVGVKLSDKMGVDVGFYIVPRETVSGPILSLYIGNCTSVANGPSCGVVPDSRIDMSNKITAGQIALNFKF